MHFVYPPTRGRFESTLLTGLKASPSWRVKLEEWTAGGCVYLAIWRVTPLEAHHYIFTLWRILLSQPLGGLSCKLTLEEYFIT